MMGVLMNNKSGKMMKSMMPEIMKMIKVILK
jgi:hypothetical protein